MKLHYLEIVSPAVDALCKQYEAVHNASFSEPDEMLGGARTCTLNDESIVGIRRPLRDTETPIIRPYWLVEDINKAVKNMENEGAKIAMRPIKIPGKGTFAIYIQGGTENGLWQL